MVLTIYKSNVKSFIGTFAHQGHKGKVSANSDSVSQWQTSHVEHLVAQKYRIKEVFYFPTSSLLDEPKRILQFMLPTDEV